MLLLRKNNTNEFWIVSFIIFLALILRLYTIGDRSLWKDELWQVNFYYSNSIGELINNAAKHAQPPLDYFIGYLLMKVFPFSETIVRLPAAIAGTLTVYLVYCVTKQLYPKNIAIMAAILTAISPYLIKYSQEARPYSIFVFALFVTLYFYSKVLKGNTIFYWMMFGISLYFLLLIRVLEPIVAILVINIINILYHKLSKTTFYIAAISTVVFLLYFPFFRIVLKTLQQHSEHQTGSISLWEDVRHKLQDFPLGGLMYIGYEFTKPISVLFIIFIVLGFYSIFIDKEKINAKLFASFALFMPLLHVFIFAYKVDIREKPFYLRYYIYVLPFVYILIAIGITNLWKWVRARGKKVYLSYGVGLSILIFFISFGTNLNAYYKSQKHDWRGISSYIKQVSKAEPIIVTDSPIIEYGQQKPRFEGRFIYYKGVQEYGLNELVDYALTRPHFKGEIFLVLYYWKKDPFWEEFCRESGAYYLCVYVLNYSDGEFIGRIKTTIEKMIAEYQINRLQHPCCEELCKKVFYHLCVYRLNYTDVNFVDKVETLIDKMIAEYPQNGSMVSLYVNKGKIAIYRGKIDQANQYFEKARQYVPRKFAGYLEKEIKGQQERETRF